MKYLGLAFGVSLTIASVLFGISWVIAHNLHLSEGLGALPIIGSHHLAEMLERRDARRSLAPDRVTAVHTFEGFTLSWPLMVTYGAIILAVVPQLASAFGGLVLSILFPSGDASPNQVATILGAFSYPVQLIGGYFVGQFVGTRTRELGIPTVILVAALGAVIGRGLDIAFVSDRDFEELYGRSRSFNAYLFMVTVTFVVFTVPALIGFWRGRRARLSKYLHYLLGVLPRDTRDVLVKLAFDEAQRVGNGGVPVTQGAAGQGAPAPSGGAPRPA